MQLAKLLVHQFHDEPAAIAAEEHFIAVFQQKALPKEISEFALSTAELGENGLIRVAKLLVLLQLQSSLSEAKRSMQGGAVSINELKILDPNS